jgi:hypothetical protein
MIRLYKSQTLGHIYKIAKKTPKQHFEGNMTKMSVIIPLWVPLTKCQNINTFVTKSSDSSAMTPH